MPPRTPTLPLSRWYTAFKALNKLYEDAVYLNSYCNKRTSRASFLIIKLAVGYTNSPGASSVPYIPDTVILTAAKDTKGAESSANGCTFTSLNLDGNVGSFLLYNDAGKYNLHFTNINGTIKKPTQAEQIVKLIFSAVPVLPFVSSVVPPGLADPATKTGALYDAFVKAAASYALQTQAAAFVTVAGEPSASGARSPSGPTLRVGLPWLEFIMRKDAEIDKPDIGSLEFYSQRSVSRILDDASGTITAGKILGNINAGEPHRCIMKTPGCESEIKTFSARLSVSDNTVDISKLADETNIGATEWQKLFLSCRKLKEVISDVGLSTVDAHLVRWAFIARHHLTALFEDRNTVWNKNIKMVGAPKPQELCWTADDRAKLTAIAEVMGGIRFAEE
jgi:hypothetical protein